MAKLRPSVYNHRNPAAGRPRNAGPAPGVSGPVPQALIRGGIQKDLEETMNRRHLSAFALLLLAGLGWSCSLFKASDALDETPVRELVIVYSGDTEGEVDPCG